MLQATFFQIYFVIFEPVVADGIALSKPTFVKFMLRVDHYMTFEEANLNWKKTLWNWEWRLNKSGVSVKFLMVGETYSIAGLHLMVEGHSIQLGV